MGLCLLVYSLGQRSLRQALERTQQSIDHQLGKPTAKPTLRPCVSMFHVDSEECFQTLIRLLVSNNFPFTGTETCSREFQLDTPPVAFHYLD